MKDLEDGTFNTAIDEAEKRESDQEGYRSVIVKMIDAKHNRIAIPGIQKEICQILSQTLSSASLRKIIKNDLKLRWKRVRHQGACINSAKNIEARYHFAK